MRRPFSSYFQIRALYKYITHPQWPPPHPQRFPQRARVSALPRARSRAPKHYLRVVDNNFEDGDDAGMPLPPGTRILTWVMPRLLWQMGVVSFSQAMCSNRRRRWSSCTGCSMQRHGRRPRADRNAGGPRAVGCGGHCGRVGPEDAQHTAVEGYRIFIICSRIQMAFCNTLMTACQQLPCADDTLLVPRWTLVGVPWISSSPASKRPGSPSCRSTAWSRTTR